MRHNITTWKHLVFYGEVVGFALAWVVGVVLLTRSESPEPRLASVDRLANAEVGRHDVGPGGEKLE